MVPRVVVVDGSNLATEGRSMPSLRQLDECVRAFMAEHPDDTVIVVVDATFGHRIDASEVAEFDEAVRNAELVTPPAGAVGRGDAFVLQIADKAGAAILSNDSFQEFHGEYPWLFDEGRLIGGKPVPHIGWVFVSRAPVRGPASRKAVRDARKTKPKPVKAEKRASTAAARPGDGAAETANGKKRRRSRPEKPEPINEALPFIEFIADHPLGTVVEGEVESFSSHGAYVLVGGARCYAPLRNLGDPTPRSAKQVLTVGERRRFVVVALEPTRRSIDLALPGVARVEVPVPEPAPPMSKAEAKRARKAAKELEAAERAAGETATRISHAPVVTADRAREAIGEEPAPAPPEREGERAEPTRRVGVEPGPTETAPERPPEVEPEQVPPAVEAPAGKRTTARKRGAPRKAAAKGAPATKKAVAPEVGPEEAAATKRGAPRKAAAKRAPATKKAAPKKAAPKKAAPKKAAPKKAAPKKAAEKAAPKKAAAKKAAAKKAAPKKAAAKKAAPRKAAAKASSAGRTATEEAVATRTAPRRHRAGSAPAHEGDPAPSGPERVPEADS